MTGSRKLAIVLLGMAVLGSTWAAAQTEEANKVFGQASGSTLCIVGYGADKAEFIKGSALALSEDVIVTAYHVISRASDVEAINSKGKKVKVEGIIGFDKAHDIALLKLKGKVPPLPIGTTDNLVDGARILALGANLQAQILILEGTMRRIVDTGPGGQILDVSLSAVPEQFRGGPLLDVNGQLIGMLLVVGDRGLKFGLPIGTLVSVPRLAKVVDFKTWTPEDFLETVEGNAFAGRAAAALEEHMTARINLEKAVKLDPNFLDGYIQLAAIYSEQRDYTAALGAYQKITELDPSRSDAYYGLGSVLLKQNRWQEAAAALDKAIALNYTGKEVHLDLGTAREQLQDFAGAASAYETFIGLRPAVTWEAYLHLGICRIKLGQFDAAIAALLEARKGQPDDVQVNLTLGEAYEKAGRLEEAEGVYNAMAAANPPDARRYYQIAYQMYDSAKQYEKAVVPLRKIIDLDRNNETNYYYLGLTYFNAQKFDEAIAAFQQALNIKADFPHAWYQVGSAYIQQKKFKEAAAAYKKFTEISPEEPSGWLSLGVCYMQLKDNESALEPLRKSVELKPDNAVAWYNLALVYINLKDNFSAKEIFNRLTKLDPALAERLKKYLR